ncbi:MAG: tRNA-dihydrouridine synthase family protein [Bacteroidales bacterium]
MYLILAPLQGVTEFPFRNAYAEFFTGIDEFFSPFIPCVTGASVKRAYLKDVLPDNQNPGMRLIPQVLGNKAAPMRLMGEAFAGLGYHEMNWNLGCPSNTVSRRMRGCGLMPHPGTVREILEMLLPELPLSLSVKLRLGMHAREEIFKMLEVLNDYPIRRIILHPRLGSWQYSGKPDLDTFAAVLPLSLHPMVYNGDINDAEYFWQIRKKFPELGSWMLGRGVLMNPFLPGLLRGELSTAAVDAREHLMAFHDRLIDHILKTGVTEHRLVGRLKEFWGYFSKWFEEPAKVWYEVSHASGSSDIRKKIERQFDRNLVIP